MRPNTYPTRHGMVELDPVFCFEPVEPDPPAESLPDSALAGPMGPLLRRLGDPAGPGGARDLKQELENLYVSIKDVYTAEDPSHTARWWMKEVRDLFHEIKDYCDLSPPTQWDLTGFAARVRALREGAHLAAGDWNHAATAKFSGEYMHLPVPAAPMEDLVQLLAFSDDKARQVRVVTLFGFAGAVNTRAARTLYDLYGGRFQCRAFVRASRDPDMRSLFTSILQQIKAPPQGFSADVSTLVRSINNHLQHKRYLIVIDDLWTTPERNFIMGSFPAGYCHSRIITTTQAKDVALASCDSYLQNIFEMTPLNDDQSAAGRNPTPEELKDEVNCIYGRLAPELKTCLLYLNMYQPGYTIRKEELVKQWIAEGFILTEKETWAEKKKLAEHYFDELVKKELIQPVERSGDDKVISCTVEHMVLDMIANKCKEVGFITTVGVNLEAAELPGEAHRLSVQFRGEKNAKIPGNIVLTKVGSLAFSGSCGCVPSLVECRLLRVLILHIWADRGHGNFDLSGISGLILLTYVKVRCNGTVNLPHKISNLSSLETLEVDATVGTFPSDITSLPGLLHLSLPSGNVPTNIKALERLRSLGCFDLSTNSEENVKKLLELENLEDLHLTCSAAHESSILEKKMDVILCSIFSPHKSLRSLELVVPTGSNHANTGAFFVNIEDTTGGPSNSVQTEDPTTSDIQPSEDPLSSPSALERIELSPRVCIFSTIPKRFAGLGRLRILKIAVRELSSADVHVLGLLPELTALSLYVWITFGAHKVERAKSGNTKNDPPTIEFGCDVFQVLSYFKFTCPAPCLTFLRGAMPQVRRLKLRFNVSTIGKYGLLPAGLEHLKGLGEISVKIGNNGDYESYRQKAKSALVKSFQSHSIQPIVNMQSVDHIFGADQPEGANSDWSSLLSESSSFQQNSGEDDVHCAKARRLYLYIIGHKNYKLIQREKELMIIIIEGNKEDNQGASKEKWILQLQELVYDIEDFIYILSWLTMRWSDKDIVSRMKDLKRRIKTLRNWQYAAQLSQSGDSTVAGAATTTSVPLGYQMHPYCYTPESKLIGMDRPKDELLQLMDTGSSYDKPLRVISVVGCRGLGKTRLARAVYDHHLNSTGHFQRFAWVVASDCSSSGDLLNKIRQQLVPQEGSSTTGSDSLLRKDQSKERYLLVIDQVQRAEVWHCIENAFPHCDVGSRIIVITSIQSVAAAAAATTHSSTIYNMQRLGDNDSKRLFWNTFYGRGIELAPALAEDSESIFKKCDGLPLPLLSMARYFRQHHQTGRIERFGGTVGGAPAALGEMNSALAQCYSSLYDNGHRACLLSLSIFPEGHQINRKSVIRRWVAEELVAGDGKRNGEEVAADRFDELIDRNIIEPVLIGNNSRVKRCRVHGLMLEFIINRAISRNFVTLISKDEAVPNKQDHLVRRLSVQDSTEESRRVATEFGLSVLRSLTCFKSVVLDFQSCKLLRILDLEGCTGISDAVLHAVCQQLILKFLSLRGSDIHRIPKRIRRLQYLETLDLRETDVEKLPIEVIRLPWLAHLFGKFDLPRELKDGKKNSKLHKFLSEESRLQTLSGFVMDKNSGSESIILDARFLRKVKIWRKSYSAFSSEEILVSCINRRFSGSSALMSLSIEIGTHGSPGFLHSLEGPCMLSSMKLSGQIGKLPDFITSSVTTIRELQLSSTGLSSQELSLLQKLPCLLYLKLYEDNWGFGSGNFVIESNGFPSLERLFFQAPTIPQLDIKDGAKTKLASLYLLCPEYPPSRIKGVEYLRHLNEVVLHDSLEPSELQVWNETATKHQNRPRVRKQATSS